MFNASDVVNCIARNDFERAANITKMVFNGQELTDMLAAIANVAKTLHAKFPSEFNQYVCELNGSVHLLPPTIPELMQQDVLNIREIAMEVATNPIAVDNVVNILSHFDVDANSSICIDQLLALVLTAERAFGQVTADAFQFNGRSVRFTLLGINVLIEVEQCNSTVPSCEWIRYGHSAIAGKLRCSSEHIKFFDGKWYHSVDLRSDTISRDVLSIIMQISHELMHFVGAAFDFAYHNDCRFTATKLLFKECYSVYLTGALTIIVIALRRQVDDELGNATIDNSMIIDVISAQDSLPYMIAAKWANPMIIDRYARGRGSLYASKQSANESGISSITQLIVDVMGN